MPANVALWQACRARAPSRSPRRCTAPRATADSPQQPSGGTLAGVAAAAGVALFLLTRAGSGQTLASLAAEAEPLDAALRSGRPTIVEFYADWCEVCRESAPAVAAVAREQKGVVSLAMLNVDAPKWAAELEEYGVDGVPQYVFLDGAGVRQATLVGKLPPAVLEADARALAQGLPLPYTGVQVRGSVSLLAEGGERPAPDSSPRAHSSN